MFLIISLKHEYWEVEKRMMLTALSMPNNTLETVVGIAKSNFSVDRWSL